MVSAEISSRAAKLAHRPVTAVEVLSALTALIAVAGVAAVAPSIPVTYGHGPVRTVVETSSALVALLAAFLVFGRYRRSPVLGDLALVQAFVVLAVANLLPNVVPALAAEGDTADALRLRLVLVGGLLASGAFVAAAMAGDVHFAGRRPSPLVAAAAGLFAPAVGVIAFGVLHLHPGPNTPTTRALDALSALMFGLAALGFGVRAAHRGDDDHLSPWLAAGCVLAAVGRLSFAVSVRTASNDLRIGDLSRFAFYLVLLLGAVAEIRSYWQRLAVLEERRRLARDLHDGVAQELAFIATEVRRAPERVQLRLVAAAAQRALDESRRAISALSRPLDQPLDDAIAEAAEEVANRIGIPLRLDLARATGLQVPAETREQLVRILREAVANAARHANPHTITVVLAKEPHRMRLQVIDDGHGFTPSAVRAERVGLVTMTERAKAIGGALSIASEVGTGTIVDLLLPVPTPAPVPA